MAAPPDEASLESLINKATNPMNKENDWESIKAFWDLLNNETEGPQLATRLLAHKIQSPQEWEALQALTLLETCMKNCGKRFHTEVAKFRFLNELIKVVSPKYLGSRAPEPVKKKVLEVMFSWTLGLPEETKIADAYQMLKKQGIVKQDPVLPHDTALPPPAPRATSALFEDEEKSKMLSRLLNSSHPEDLRAANKLINEMVQEDQKRTEKVSKRLNAIQEVKESVSLLGQLLENYSKDRFSHSQQELVKDLYNRCEKMRPTLFRLASDTEDNDEALAEILQANDSLTQVINLYRQLVKGEEMNGETAAPRSLPGSSGNALLDLTGLDTSLCAPTLDPALSLLDDELMSLGLNEATSNSFSGSQLGDFNTFQSCDGAEPVAPAPQGALLLPAVTLSCLPAPPPAPEAPAAPPSPLDGLDVLGKSLLQQSLPPENQQVKWDKSQTQSKLTLRDLQTQSHHSSGTAPSAVTTTPSPSSSLPHHLCPRDPQSAISLADVAVPLESIKPSSLLPVTVFDKHSLRVLFHFARDCPRSRPDVLVVIISMLSSAPLPISSIRFQSAVPKVMKVRLQPPSGTDLPAFNPVLPPAAITQILLLANPQQEKVRLRYKLTFNLGDKSHDESGDVEEFPPPDSWGNL
ncbi:ADP-ribosylation factor-binding protein GGA1-like [Gadus chalcogrammus]|uniref:ADP-ribosylation factor-binding protein GGA1-like n=1 Tax=Gadus chalcogrammus TaxID=1042646 RepID=UPI0024C40B9A|nr:ADP-ribosylation factor-binding protein GGA1-like [Gadus chalcogrammus]